MLIKVRLSGCVLQGLCGDGMLESRGRGVSKQAERLEVHQLHANLWGLRRLVPSMPSWSEVEALLDSLFKLLGRKPQRGNPNILISRHRGVWAGERLLYPSLGLRLLRPPPSARVTAFPLEHAGSAESRNRMSGKQLGGKWREIREGVSRENN